MFPSHACRHREPASHELDLDVAGVAAQKDKEQPPADAEAGEETEEESSEELNGDEIIADFSSFETMGEMDDIADDVMSDDDFSDK